MAEPVDPDARGALDAALVQRCREGDERAWRELVMRYQRLVDAIARRAGLDEGSAADVLQEVFTRLLQHIHALREPHRLQAWIVTTAKRETLRRRALGQREVLVDATPGADEGPGLLEQIPDPGALPDDVLDELQQLDRLRAAFERLDERCRQLLGALFQEDPAPDYETLAARLGMPLGSLGPTRGRCLQRLRQLLAS